jgi:hypothetical protein
MANVAGGIIFKTMKRHKFNFCFSIILLANILAYFFKIDRDIYSIQEYYHHPHQTYSEQLYSQCRSYFVADNSDNVPFAKSWNHEKYNIDQPSIWNAISSLYGARVLSLFKIHENTTTQNLRFISILHKQNICHKSSEGDAAV